MLEPTPVPNLRSKVRYALFSPDFDVHILTRDESAGLVESLSKETAHLGIKTLLIEPGRFRTKLLSTSNLSAVPTKVPEYAEASSALHQHLAEEDQKQDGDASKAIKVILDLVRREGCAEGRDVPFRLPLGPDCFTEMKEKCEETLRVLEDWKPVITGTNFEE